MDERLHRYSAHAPAAAIDQNPEQDTIDDRDGVTMDPIVDDEYHDDFEWMDIDLPGDSAVSNREYTLLRNMRKQLDRDWNTIIQHWP